MKNKQIQESNDQAEPRQTSGANQPATEATKVDAAPAVGSSDLLDSLEDRAMRAIHNLQNEQTQNLSLEPEYGSIQAIEKFQQDWEIQNDGQGKFVQVQSHMEERILEQNHPKLQQEQSRHNNAQEADQISELKSQCVSESKNEQMNQGQGVSYNSGEAKESNDQAEPRQTSDANQPVTEANSKGTAPAVGSGALFGDSLRKTTYCVEIKNNALHVDIRENDQSGPLSQIRICKVIDKIQLQEFIDGKNHNLTVSGCF